MNRIIVGIFAILCSINVYSQDNVSAASLTHIISFNTQYIQIKDEFNYGLVFSGPNLVAGYSLARISDKDILQYSLEIGFGGVFNKGAGYAWRFKPIDVYYGRILNGKRFKIGGYVAADYQWQQYSELQGGRLFWFSTIELGPKIEYALPYKSGVIIFDFSNSMVGFTSWPEPSTETYYYDFSFSEFISVANQNLSFGSFNQFNRTKIGAFIKPDSWKHFKMGYRFEYFGHYKEPALSFICHSIKLNWNL